MLLSVTAWKAVAATTLGTGLLLTGGVSAAATGSLPGAAQETASDMLAKIGVTVPGANADQRGTADADDVATGDEGGAAGQGAEVSEMAGDDETTGLEKGTEVSEEASDGMSHAGEHGSGDAAAAAEGEATEHEPRVETPNDGGTDTADDATDEQGVEAPDTDTADESSSGHSSAGSENRP